jgi:hypothetical protein
MLVAPAGTVHGVEPSVLNTTETPQDDGTIKKERAVKIIANSRGCKILKNLRLIILLPIKHPRSANTTGLQSKAIPLWISKNREPLLLTI